jgi:DNA-binding MarR family transcriptional regulator
MEDLRRSVRTLARLARVLERSCEGISLSQFRVLAVVADGDERASRLAERLSVARPTITAVVDGLVERGLLSRSTATDDRRATRIGITRAGRRALDAAYGAMQDRLDSVLGRTADRGIVLSALDQLDRALAETSRRPAGAGR